MISSTTPITTSLQIILSLLLIASLKVTNGDVAGQETLIGITGRDFILLGADASQCSSISLTSNHVDKIKLIQNPFPNNKFHDNGSMHSSSSSIIAVASAGDSADCDRLIGSLISQASLMEYQSASDESSNSLGNDVKCVYNGNGANRIKNNCKNQVSSGLDVHCVAHMARGMIASSLRSRHGQFKTCLFIAGFIPFQTKQFHEIQQQDGNHSKKLERQIHLASQEYSLDCDTVLDGNERQYTSTSTPIILSSNAKTILKPTLFWLDEYGSIQNIHYGCHGLASNFVLSILDRSYKHDLTKEEAIVLMKNCFEQLRHRFVINNPQPPCIKCIDLVNGCQRLVEKEEDMIV
jgi:20S proteasome alpha/beta subunit